MNLDGARILLTGGAGFIGSHVAEALLRSGASLSIVDNLNRFYPPHWKQANLAAVSRAGSFQFCEASIDDVDALASVFESCRPDVVIHLAAYAGVRPSITNPRLYERINVGGTVNVLQMCRRFRVRKLIFGSSSSVYGATNNVPFTENEMDLRPISPYAATKIAGEMLVHSYAHLFGISSICLRFFTVYGPRQRPDLAIYKFTDSIEAGRPIQVFGDGTSGRDYTFVSDIVDGVIASIGFEPEQRNGVRYEVFNLGNSNPVSLNELISEIERATQRVAIIERCPWQPGDVPITWANISKASEMLGYAPKMSLQEGLHQFVAWLRRVRAEREAAEVAVAA